MKKWAILIGLVALLVTAVPALATKPTDKGFDEFGYNRKARNFVGTCVSWHMGKFGSEEADARAYCGIYSDDKLVMKWSKAWDDAIFGPDGIRENSDELPWTCDAWEDNEWNGMFPEGSGETWHYKIVWVGSELESSPCWREGGDPIWGEFEVIMSHGTADGEHIWETLAEPAGYGGF